MATLCRLLGVSRSGYSAWRPRPPSARARANQELTQHLRAVHKQSRGTYGAPRIWAELRDRGVVCSRAESVRRADRTCQDGRADLECCIRKGFHVSWCKRPQKRNAECVFTVEVQPMVRRRRPAGCRCQGPVENLRAARSGSRKGSPSTIRARSTELRAAAARNTARCSATRRARR